MDPSGAAFRSEKAVAKTLHLPVQSPGTGAFEVTLSPQLLSAAPLSQVMATTGQTQPRIWISDLQCNLKVPLNLTICYTHCTSSHLSLAALKFSHPIPRQLCARLGESWKSPKPWLHLLQGCYTADCPGESILEHDTHISRSHLRAPLPKNMQMTHTIILKNSYSYIFISWEPEHNCILK